MTEKEYIDATNLAKVRAAISVLSATVTTNVQQQCFRDKAMTAMHAWTAQLEKVVETRG